jgi:hypothetical protein
MFKQQKEEKTKERTEEKQRFSTQKPETKQPTANTSNKQSSKKGGGIFNW